MSLEPINELNHINEHQQFLDKDDEQKPSSDLANAVKQNEQICLNVQYDQCSELCCCISYFHRLKRVFNWKMPWIAVLLSVVQVCFI